MCKWGRSGRPDLRVQVVNLSPKVTLGELYTFFCYCGAVDKIEFQKIGDKGRSALVTFKSIYAFQTALLLNGAILADQPIWVMPSQHDDSSSFPSIQHHRSAYQTQAYVAAKGVERLRKSRERLHKSMEEFDENYELPERQRMMADQTRSAIPWAAENGRVTVTNTDYISAGATWLSRVLNKASRWVSAKGNEKRHNPSSRKPRMSDHQSVGM